jgi:protein-export membrane protein SecD
LDRKQQAILAMIAIVALVIGALWLVIPPQKNIPEGLDIRGGLSVILTAHPETGTVLAPDQMTQAQLVINNRVNGLGIADASVQQQGASALLVQIPGIKDPQLALQTIGKTGQLEFRMVLGKGDPQADALVSTPTASDIATKYAEAKLAVPSLVTFKVSETTAAPVFNSANPGRPQEWYVLGPALIKGDQLSDARVGFDQTTNKPEVDMTFKPAGADAFAKLTQKLVQKQFAIVLDGVIQSAPTVQEPILDGKARISGSFTIDQAKRLALVLQTGALPVTMEISNSSVVGPTLGQDSLNQGLLAGVAGIIVVMLYMAFFYRGLGVLSWFSLIIFMILLMGTLTGLGRFLGAWALTLPGIAGIVFSIGSAADSSILVFERFKEEVRAGKTVRTAVLAGFKHALGTVIDADLVAIITAAFIYIFAIGPVKGFAFTLILGMVLDLVTLTLFTRSALILMSDTRALRSKALVGVKAEA